MFEKNCTSQPENSNKRVKTTAHMARSFLSNRLSEFLADDKEKDYPKQDVPDSLKRKSEYLESLGMDSSEWIPCGDEQDYGYGDESNDEFNDEYGDMLEMDIERSDMLDHEVEEEDIFNTGTL